MGSGYFTTVSTCCNITIGWDLLRSSGQHQTTSNRKKSLKTVKREDEKLCMINRYQEMEVFLETVLLFSEQNKHTNINKMLNNFSSQNKSF